WQQQLNTWQQQLSAQNANGANGQAAQQELAALQQLLATLQQLVNQLQQQVNAQNGNQQGGVVVQAQGQGQGTCQGTTTQTTAQQTNAFWQRMSAFQNQISAQAGSNNMRGKGRRRSFVYSGGNMDLTPTAFDS